MTANTVETITVHHASWCGYLFPDGTSDQQWGRPCEDTEDLTLPDGTPEPGMHHVQTEYHPESGKVAAELYTTRERYRVVWRSSDPYIVRQLGKALLRAADQMDEVPEQS